MSLLFALRGDSLTPRFAKGSKEYSFFLGGPTLNVPPLPVTLSDPSCFGGWAIESNTTAGDYREWFYLSRKNWVRNTRTFSMLVRAATNYSGTPPNDINLMRVGEPRSNTVYGGARIWLQDNNTCLFMAQPKNGLSNHFLTAPSLSSIPLVSGVFKDYMVTANDATGKWYASIDGVQVATGDLNGDGAGFWDFDWINAPNIIFGTWPFRGWINEALIWDSCEPHVYSPRTAWLDCPDFEGESYSDPGEAHVEKDVSYIFAGASKTGTYEPAVPETVDPGEANVRDGQAYKISGVDKEGTAIIPDPSDVREGVAVDAAVGTCAVPSPSDVTRDVPVDNTVGTRDTVTNEVGGAVAVGEDNQGTASFNEEVI